MNKNLLEKFIIIALCFAMIFGSGCTLPGTGIQNEEIPESTEGQDLTMTDAADDVFSLNMNTKYSFNPLVATNHSNQLVCSLVYENLIELDNNFTPIPNVITEWKYSDDAANWTLTVDTNRTFHDGSNVTAKDVAYTLNNLNSAGADRFAGRFRAFGGATAQGDDTVNVFLGIGDTQFITLLNIPLIKSGSFKEKFPIGSGPYDIELKTEEVEPATETKEAKTRQVPVKLVAYEGHKDYKLLPVDTVYLKEYQEAETTIDAFESSLIDAVINDPSSYTNLGYAATNEVHTYATTNMHYVAFNQESTLAANPTFRFAMQYAFDREYLVDLLGGNAVSSSIPMYPTCATYPSSLADKLSFNLETCRRVLENAGIRDYDDDGWMEYMNAGAKINLNFILCSDSSAKAGIANRFAQDMASIGLRVTVQELTWDEYYNALTDYVNLTKEQKEDEDFEEIEYDMYYAETKVRNDFDITEIIAPRTEDNQYSNINFTHSTDKGYETYLYNYLASGDQSRSQNYEQFANYVLTSSAHFVTVGFEKQELITHRGAVKGVNPNMGNPLYDFQNWEISFKNINTEEDEEETAE